MNPLAETVSTQSREAAARRSLLTRLLPESPAHVTVDQNWPDDYVINADSQELDLIGPRI